MKAGVPIQWGYAPHRQGQLNKALNGQKKKDGKATHLYKPLGQFTTFAIAVIVVPPSHAVLLKGIRKADTS